MKNLSLSLALCTALLFGGCDTNCVYPEGSVVEIEHELDSFSDVAINCSADVILTQSKNKSSTVTVETEENIHELVKLKVVDDELVIDMEGCIRNSSGVTVYVSLPYIDVLEVNGSGDFSTNGTFKQTESAFLTVGGSGDMKLQLKSTFVSASIEGSGDIKLTGKTDTLLASINGSGDIKAFKFPSNVATTMIDGSGDIEVKAKKKLDVFIDGSGDVKYKGSPKIESSIDGSGDLRKKD